MITQERAKELFEYDPETGVVTRRIDWHRGKKGSVVGSVSTKNLGYRNLTVSVDRQRMGVHTLIWLMQTGAYPQEIDHINGDAFDNRWANLRDTDRRINGRNLPKFKNNKSGITGVHFVRAYDRWRASIRVNRRSMQLYYGDSFFDACCKRKSAELRYGFHDNHGKRMAEGQKHLA